MNDTKDLSNSVDHFGECHQRWSGKRNRKIENPEYRDEWWREQCLACRYFIPLTGIFMEDYGACTNKNSRFDKNVMFEHDGCEQFTEVENF